MDKTNVTIEKKKISEPVRRLPQQGDVYAHKAVWLTDPGLYLVCKTGMDLYILANVRDGNLWTQPTKGMGIFKGKEDEFTLLSNVHIDYEI